MKWYTFTYKEVWNEFGRVPYQKKNDIVDDIVKAFGDGRKKPNIIRIDEGFYEYLPSKNIDGKPISIIREDKIDEYGFRNKLNKYYDEINR